MVFIAGMPDLRSLERLSRIPWRPAGTAGPHVSKHFGQAVAFARFGHVSSAVLWLRGPFDTPVHRFPGGGRLRESLGKRLCHTFQRWQCWQCWQCCCLT